MFIVDFIPEGWRETAQQNIIRHLVDAGKWFIQTTFYIGSSILVILQRHIICQPLIWLCSCVKRIWQKVKSKIPSSDRTVHDSNSKQLQYPVEEVTSFSDTTGTSGYGDGRLLSTMTGPDSEVSVSYMCDEMIDLLRDYKKTVAKSGDSIRPDVSDIFLEVKELLHLLICKEHVEQTVKSRLKRTMKKIRMKKNEVEQCIQETKQEEEQMVCLRDEIVEEENSHVSPQHHLAESIGVQN